MMGKLFLIALLFIYAHSECESVSLPLPHKFLLSKGYVNISITEPRNVITFYRGLRSAGIDPTGIELVSMRVKKRLIKSLYSTIYTNDLGSECFFKFSVIIISIHTEEPVCTEIVTAAPPTPPVELTTTTENTSTKPPIMVKDESNKAVPNALRMISPFETGAYKHLSFCMNGLLYVNVDDVWELSDNPC